MLFPQYPFFWIFGTRSKSQTKIRFNSAHFNRGPCSPCLHILDTITWSLFNMSGNIPAHMCKKSPSNEMFEGDFLHPINYSRFEPSTVIELMYFLESVMIFPKSVLHKYTCVQKMMKYNVIISIQNSCMKLQPFTALVFCLHSHEHFVTIRIITMGNSLSHKTKISDGN